LDDQRWQDKDTLITHTGLAILTQPIRDHLAELEERLEALWSAKILSSCDAPRHRQIDLPASYTGYLQNSAGQLASQQRK
jgi:hypothetical protein